MPLLLLKDLPRFEYTSLRRGALSHARSRRSEAFPQSFEKATPSLRGKANSSVNMPSAKADSMWLMLLNRHETGRSTPAGTRRKSRRDARDDAVLFQSVEQSCHRGARDADFFGEFRGRGAAVFGAIQQHQHRESALADGMLTEKIAFPLKDGVACSKQVQKRLRGGGIERRIALRSAEETLETREVFEEQEWHFEKVRHLTVSGVDRMATYQCQSGFRTFASDRYGKVRRQNSALERPHRRDSAPG